MKKIILLSIIFLAIANVHAEAPRAEKGTAQEKIQVAILLDTSGSMQGLIEQAKSRLWDIVNTLTTLKYKGKAPKVEIALYEYGSHNRYGGDYIRQITPLTTDLDLISEKLFVLQAGGSEEFCGTVIHKATRDLEWGNNEADMKLIYIAGNEVFEQGEIRYKDAIKRAVGKNIYVNTIHCGDRSIGIRDYWQDAAIRGEGKFFNIDSNVKVKYIVSPYDGEINECNKRLNDTYISYGRLGASRKESQIMQDANAESISSANYTERAISKSKAMYVNTSWDLVDKYNEDKTFITGIDKNLLPNELQGKTKEELETIIQNKTKERADLQKQINQLAINRKAYIDNQADGSKNAGNDLGKAITESILALAKVKGYSAE